MSNSSKRGNSFWKISRYIANKRVGSARKKGAILVEFIVAIPILMLLIWGIMNLMLYLLAASTLNEASYEASRAIAVEMRGEEDNIIHDYHVGNVRSNIELIVDRDNFLNIMSDGNEPTMAYSKEECSNAFQSKNAFCAYVESYESNGRTHQQVVVQMRSGFEMIGSFIPSLTENMTISAKSVAQKEIASRYNYID